VGDRTASIAIGDDPRSGRALTRRRDSIGPRPELGGSMEAQLEPIVRLLAEQRGPFRIRAT